MKRRTRIWVEYGKKYLAHDDRTPFEIREVEDKPTRMQVIIYKADGCVADRDRRVTQALNLLIVEVLECDLSLSYLQYIDKQYGVFIQIPREAAR